MEFIENLRSHVNFVDVGIASATAPHRHRVQSIDAICVRYGEFNAKPPVL